MRMTITNGMTFKLSSNKRVFLILDDDGNVIRMINLDNVNSITARESRVDKYVVFDFGPEHSVITITGPPEDVFDVLMGK